MIKKLGEKDRQAILEFLREDASLNRILIENIEKQKFNKEEMEVWGNFNKQKEMDGILLRFQDHYITYYKSTFDNKEGFRRIIKENETNIIFEGRDDLTGEFNDLFPNFIKKSTTFAELKNNNFLLDKYPKVKKATESDSERIYGFLKSIKEFENGGEDSPQDIRKRIREKEGRVYYIESLDGEIISSAQTTTEGRKSALIISVATKKEYRGNGLASKCLSTLCRDLIEEGKYPCLYYLDEKAGRVYKKLGFETIGLWSLIIKIENNF